MLNCELRLKSDLNVNYIIVSFDKTEQKKIYLCVSYPMIDQEQHGFSTDRKYTFCLFNKTSLIIWTHLWKETYKPKNLCWSIICFFRSVRWWAKKNCKSFNCTIRKLYWNELPWKKFRQKSQRQIQSYFPWIRNYIAHGCNYDDESFDKLKMTPT